MSSAAHPRTRTGANFYGVGLRPPRGGEFAARCVPLANVASCRCPQTRREKSRQLRVATCVATPSKITSRPSDEFPSVNHTRRSRLRSGYGNRTSKPYLNRAKVPSVWHGFANLDRQRARTNERFCGICFQISASVLIQFWQSERPVGMPPIAILMIVTCTSVKMGV